MIHGTRVTAFTLLLLGLTACGPLPVYYNAGHNQAQTQDATLSCQVQSLKQAPVANQLRQRPPVYYPGSRHCANGSCWARPGYWVDGGSYTVDVNQGLRQQLEQRCMATSGYQKIELPRCSQQQIASLQAQPNGTRPGHGLTPESCALRQKDGRTVILPAL
ncbi:hypothetical protein [Pseudophaeobacter flagellatus]|uniref:hypothetical protein n=1 Tax=Pseudophaeobacter flagellatus TaxID=2899119 RepID=UPI001E2E76E5|nr:hypothetical protein [Pseudophaeobacter flagellatus]MCD9146861.1 hypothetical protein [Pseudophaeobacter flagellatus]